MFCLSECKSPFLELYADVVRSGESLLLEGLGPSSKALAIERLVTSSQKSTLVLTGAGVEEFKLYNDLPFFSSYPLVELTAWETLPSENIPPSPDIVGSRYTAL